MEYLITLFALVFGAIFGSFLNVIIHRIPLKQSIVFPASHCPHCKNRIKPYDNIPVLSYIILFGKCRNCKTKIPFRYILVELITAISFALLVVSNNFFLDLNLLKNLIFFTTGIAIIFIDIKHFIIPDVISLPLIIVGIIFSFFVNDPGWKSGLSGAVAGFILFYSIAWIYIKLRGEIGLGGGDIKYLTAIGAFVGITGLFFVLFFSSVFALIAYLFSAWNNSKNLLKDSNKELKQKILPYGPFLAGASFLYILTGNEIINLYLNLIYGVL